MSTAPEPVHAIKGFNPDLTCRGFQFAEGQTYEHGGPVSLCNSGFHAVILPLDVLGYYPAGQSVYREVELDGVATSSDGDSKVVARKVTVGASINLAGIVRAHVEAIWNQIKKPSVTTGGSAHAVTTGGSAHAVTTGRYAHAATTGYSANAATTGYYANAVTTGGSAHAATTGGSANAATTGGSAHAVTTGYYAHAATTGYYAHAATTGRYAHAATTGRSAHAATTGYSANAATTGRYANAATTGYSNEVRAGVADEGSIAAVLGQGAAKGALGCWLVLTERDDNLDILGVQAVQVDGEQIRADVYYTLRGGRAVAL